MCDFRSRVDPTTERNHPERRSQTPLRAHVPATSTPAHRVCSGQWIPVGVELYQRTRAYIATGGEVGQSLT